MHQTVLRVVLTALIFITPLVQAKEEAAYFDLETDSGTISLNDFRGKVLYIDFWASWCTPCRKSFPWLNQMQKRYKNAGLVVLAINLDKDSDLAHEFLKKYPAEFLVAYDPSNQSARDYKLRGMPSSYLINRRGYIVSSHIGFRQDDTEKFESAIKDLLTEK